MAVARVSEIVQKRHWLDRGYKYFKTKDGKEVNPNAGNIALGYQKAQEALIDVTNQINGLLGYAFFGNLNYRLGEVIPKVRRNENDFIWQKFMELEKLLAECTLLDSGKLSEISKLCEEFGRVLDPEIDIENNNYMLVTKGTQIVDTPKKD
ncbi:MAG: hypothetical protein HY094_06160 [Candidatus Melainabacteria bacterium]|nr:hypothetical protein [Candidatus Melainabacteria bacterium]